MSANLNVFNGQVSFVETNKGAGAWHGLGKRVNVDGDSGIDVKKALELSQANYNVQLQPILAVTPQLLDSISNDEMINAGELLKNIISGVKTTMRTDNNKPLGIVSESYGVLQNSRMFEVLGLIASGKDMNREDVPVVETAGVLGNGERCFVTMKFPTDIRLNTKKDDPISFYLVAQNSHDNSGTFKILISPVRVVCQNTLQLALNNAVSKISFRHTRFINERVDMLDKDTAEMAYKTLGIYDVYKQHLEAEFERLRKIKVNDKWAEKVLANALLPDDIYSIYKKNDYNINSDDISSRSKNLLHNALDVLDNGIGQDNAELRGTGMYVINGLTTFFQNEMNWNNKDKKFLSITEGTCYDKLQKAHKMLLEAV